MKPAPPVIRMRMNGSGGAELGTEPLDRRPEAVVERDARLPAEDALRFRDVGLAHFRIVDRQILVDDLGTRAAEVADALGELLDRHLDGIAEVRRLLLVGPQELREAFYEIVHVAEA